MTTTACQEHALQVHLCVRASAAVAGGLGKSRTQTRRLLQRGCLLCLSPCGLAPFPPQSALPVLTYLGKTANQVKVQMNPEDVCWRFVEKLPEEDV